MKQTGNDIENAILEAAIKVFAQEGFHNTNLNMIAKISGINQDVIKSVFECKEAILSKIFENLWEQLYQKISLLVINKDFTPIEKINLLIDYFFDLFSSDQNLAIVFVNDQINIPKSYQHRMKYHIQFLQAGELILKDGMDKGFINKKFDIKIFRYFLFGGIRYLLDMWTKNPKSLHSEVLRQNLKQIIQKGITECKPNYL